MAADVMQGCRPGSAWQLGGPGSRLRLWRSSLSICSVRYSALFFPFPYTRGGFIIVPLRPARPSFTVFGNQHEFLVFVLCFVFTAYR